MKAVFMSPKTSTTTKWALASYALRDAFTDFILSRQASQCTARRMGFDAFAIYQSRIAPGIQTAGGKFRRAVFRARIKAHVRDLAVKSRHGGAPRSSFVRSGFA